eukprot:RCo006092
MVAKSEAVVSNVTVLPFLAVTPVQGLTHPQLRVVLYPTPLLQGQVEKEHREEPSKDGSRTPPHGIYRPPSLRGESHPATIPRSQTYPLPRNSSPRLADSGVQRARAFTEGAPQVTYSTAPREARPTSKLPISSQTPGEAATAALAARPWKFQTQVLLSLAAID